MKKYIKSVLPALALMALSCEKGPEPTETKSVSFTSAITDYTESETLKWTKGDKVGIYMVEEGRLLSDKSVLENAYNVSYTAAEDGATLTASSKGIIYPLSGEAVDFVAYSPYTAISNYLYPVDVSDQSDPKKIDLLYSNSAKSIVASDAAVELPFTHALAKYVVKLTPKRGVTAEDLKGIEVSLRNMPTKADFRLSDGTLSDYSGITASVSMASRSDDKYQAIVLPQPADMYGEREVVLNIPAVGYLTCTLPAEMEFKAGTVVESELEVSLDEVKLINTEISSWMSEDIEEIAIYPPDYFENTSNCFIVSPGESVEFSINKAFKVWREWIDLKDLNTDLSGKIEAAVVWSDVENLVSVSLTEAEEREKSMIKVLTNGSTPGNAVVAVKIDGTIRWSWHIWVTDYNPEEDFISYSNGYMTTVFMDRNMGATSNTPDDLSSMGMYYQWGRKDPFPAPNIKDMGERGYISNADGTYDRSIYGAQIVKEVTPEGLNLPNAIANPNIFFIATGLPHHDWYSTDDAIKSSYLWSDHAGRKTVWDPCPDGWRVPVGGEIYGFEKKDLPLDGIGPSLWEWKESGFEDVVVGWWPACGYQATHENSLCNVGETGHYWLGTAMVVTPQDGSAKSYYGQSIMFDQSGLIGWDYNRAIGMNVRCVKESVRQ